MSAYKKSPRFVGEIRFHFPNLVSIWLLCLLLFLLLLPIKASAITTISQSYLTTDKLSFGSIVSIKNGTSDQVIAANSNNVDNLLGVVINPDSSLLTLSNEEANEVQIATNGTIQVLVSDINGSIKRGDHITASPINGVGMKANSNIRVIGIAQGDLTGGKQQTYTDTSGMIHSVTLGQIPILVSVFQFFKEPEKTLVPSALQNVANALAGKTVETLPIVISSAIFVVMMIVVAVIVYSMIRSSIISVGRNPMSQSAIYRDLVQMSLLVFGILAVGITTIYLVLTRM